MGAALRIALREARERRAVLAAALVAGLLPFASPLLPGVSAARAGEAREAMAALLMLGFGLILALLLGATAVARDLAENRLSFDFARPVGALAIWAGRFGAAIGLTFLSMTIVAAPAMLVGGRLALPDRAQRVPELWLALAAAVLLAIGIAHVAAVSFRSRSRWLVLDLVGLVVVLLLAASAVRRLFEASAEPAAVIATAAMVVATLPALWIASAVQVARGRTDLVLGHRVQSITLWSMLLGVAVLLSACSLWFVAAGPEDLERVSGEGAANGDWLVTSGTAAWRPGFEPIFLHDLKSGRWIPLGSGHMQVLFSEDGRHAVSLRRGRVELATLELLQVDLTSSDPGPRPTTLTFKLAGWIVAALSPRGERIAVVEGKNLSVHSLPEGRILAAARLDESAQGTGLLLTFLGEDRVRAYALGERLMIHELDVAGRALHSRAGPDAGAGDPWIRRSLDERRLLMNGAEGAMLLVDAETGSIVRTLGEADELADPDLVLEGQPQRHRDALFLADGRIALLEAATAERRAALRLLTADGAPSDVIELGPGSRFPRLAGEPAPGRLLLSLGGLEPSARVPRLLLVDLATRRTQEIEGGGFPARSWWWGSRRTPAPGSAATRLVMRDHALWVLEPETAALRRVAGRSRGSDGA